MNNKLRRKLTSQTELAIKSLKVTIGTYQNNLKQLEDYLNELQDKPAPPPEVGSEVDELEDEQIQAILKSNLSKEMKEFLIQQKKQ